MTNSSLRMRRNCNLELRLSPSAAVAAAATAGEEANGGLQNQQLTIFYNGRICVCDVTEIQARAILTLATREMEERGPKEPHPSQATVSTPSTPITPGMSMKRSLQRFLQKRKHRVQATSPYHLEE